MIAWANDKLDTTCELFLEKEIDRNKRAYRIVQDCRRFIKYQFNWNQEIDQMYFEMGCKNSQRKNWNDLLENQIQTTYHR